MSPRSHNSFREGAILGAVVGTGIWVWIALVDAVVGEPFRTFAVLGGVADKVAGYLVTESVPLAYDRRTWPDGERSPEES